MLNKNTLMNMIFALLCSITVAVACFDCVISLATAEALSDVRAPTEENPIWCAFLEGGTVRAMVGIKFLGVFLAAAIMYIIRKARVLRLYVMAPVALFHIWLFLTLNYGTGSGLFTFDFSDPFFLFHHIADSIQMGVLK